MGRMENTGEWVFELKQFNDWKSAERGLLWIHGSGKSGFALYDDFFLVLITHQAGSGKTILAFVVPVLAL